MARAKKTTKSRARDRASDAEADEVLEPEIVDDDDELEASDDDGDIEEELDGDGDGQAVAFIDIDDDELEKLPSALDRDTDESAKRGSIAKYDPMAAYMAEVKRFPLLTREREHELAVQWVEEGDAGAARELIQANLRLVVKIAYEYRRAYRNLLDLVQEGNVGLMKAVEKYDPYRGVKLSSYAAWWIRAYILKFILNNWRLVKIGTTQAQRKLFFNLRKEKEKLEQLGFSPTPALLAERLDVREKDVVEMEKRLMAGDASLDAPLGGGDDDVTRTRMDLLGDESTRPDEAVEEGQFKTLLREKLAIFADTLKGREATIFRERWLTDEPRTLQQIGDQYGISRERARQLEKRMLGRLRTYLEQELGSAVDIDALGRD